MRRKSTISRECKRNACAKIYNSKFAQQCLTRRRYFARLQPKLHHDSSLFKIVQGDLYQYWSPEQIAGQLQKLHTNDKLKKVSHESIYN